MMTGMSDSLYFHVFYGPGEVRYVSEGVDLSEFKSFWKRVPRAREKTWASICNWLFKSFKLDRDLVELSVRAVVRFRTDIIFWELMPRNQELQGLCKCLY